MLTHNYEKPEMPEPDGSMTIMMIGREVEIDTYRASTMVEYRDACVEAATAPLLARIAELEDLNKTLHILMVSGEQRGVQKGLQECAERLAAVESDCAPYLKEGETPAERIKRDLGDVDSLMSLYRDVVAERDALKVELEAECEESKRWLVKAQNERDARKELEAELERIKAMPPVAWLVLSTNQDGSISVEYVAEWPEAAHEHINDAISEHDDKEAASWVVRPVIYALGSKTA